MKEEKDYYSSVYHEVWDDKIGRLIKTSKYQAAPDEKRAEMIEEIRSDIAAETQKRVVAWFRQNRRASEKKK